MFTKLQRVEIECINEETSWITEVPSVTSIIAFLNYTFLKGCNIFFQAMQCLVGGTIFTYIRVPRNLGDFPLYYPRVNKNRFLILCVF